jgi:hypothetical protein
MPVSKKHKGAKRKSFKPSRVTASVIQPTPNLHRSFALYHWMPTVGGQQAISTYLDSCDSVTLEEPSQAIAAHRDTDTSDLILFAPARRLRCNRLLGAV